MLLSDRKVIIILTSIGRSGNTVVIIVIKLHKNRVRKTGECIEFMPIQMSLSKNRYFINIVLFAFNALTLLVGRQEEHLACKN